MRTIGALGVRARCTLIRTALIVSASVVVFLLVLPAFAKPIKKWEVPIVQSFLVCNGALERGCQSFAASNFTAAFQVFYNLAAIGDAGAQNNLGVLFEAGAGVSENKQAALFWYRRAADAGVPLAQHNLAVLIAADHLLGTTENPSNRRADFIEAYRLFARAASQGLAIAANGRSDLARYMTPEEIAAARAERWFPREHGTMTSFLVFAVVLIVLMVATLPLIATERRRTGTVRRPHFATLVGGVFSGVVMTYYTPVGPMVLTTLDHSDLGLSPLSLLALTAMILVGTAMVIAFYAESLVRRVRRERG